MSERHPYMEYAGFTEGLETGAGVDYEVGRFPDGVPVDFWCVRLSIKPGTAKQDALRILKTIRDMLQSGGCGESSSVQSHQPDSVEPSSNIVNLTSFRRSVDVNGAVIDPDDGIPF